MKLKLSFAKKIYLTVLKETREVEDMENVEDVQNTSQDNVDMDEQVEQVETVEQGEQVSLGGGGRAGSAFSAEERLLLKTAFAKDGPPKGITNMMVKLAKRRFPAFNPLWNALLAKKGDTKKAKNTILKAVGLKKKKVNK